MNGDGMKWIEKLQDIYWNIVPYDYRPSQLWYKLKCIVWKRYTTVKSRYLSHQWHDRCTVLPHTMFEILSQFIEKECSPGHVEWYGEYGHKIIVNGEEKYVRDEMQELYDWWHNVYNKEYDVINDKIWEEVHKCDPIGNKFSDWTDKMLNESGEIYAYRWSPKYETKEKEAMHFMLMKALNDLEISQHEDLQDKMHRLVNIQPYMWT
jgi:hypothetical protein